MVAVQNEPIAINMRVFDEVDLERSLRDRYRSTTRYIKEMDERVRDKLEKNDVIYQIPSPISKR